MGSADNRSVSICELARQAGVSPSTVSSILNHKHEERHLSAATVARVLQVAAALGYRPDVRARNMRARGGQRTWVVGVITAVEMPLTHVGDLFGAFERVAAAWPAPLPKLDFAVELFRAGRLHELSSLRDGSVFTGAIVTNSLPADDACLAGLQPAMPLVLWGRQVPGYSGVRLSGSSGAEAAAMLLDAGCRSPAVLCPPMLTQTTQTRLDGFRREVLCRLGRAAAEVPVAAMTDHAAQRALADFLAANPPCDGLFAFFDHFAMGAYHALKRRGLRIPGDVQVVGHDDQSLAALLDPPLSTFSYPAAAMREEAVRLLLGQLTGGLSQPEQRVFHSIAVRRESVAPLPCRRGAGPVEYANDSQPHSP